MSNAVEDFLQALKRTINGDPYPAPNPARYAPVSYRVIRLKDPLQGEMLTGKYRIESRIGKGAMATVYKAIQEPIDRVVAVKILNHNFSKDRLAVKRFKLEAKTLSSLRHRNILSVHDLGNTEKGQPFFVMEYLDGISLESLIKKRGPVPLARAVPIFGQICDGLAYAHKQGVIHRDLKPENIMLLREDNADETVKLVDFGIVKVKVDGKSQLLSQQLTRKGEVWGSPVYMSPEQCMGETIDARSDVYALGLLMYESLLGAQAITGANIGAIVSAQMAKKPAAFHDAVPELRIPESLERIVFRALEKKKDDRFASMEEVKAALESFGQQYGIKLRKTTGMYVKPGQLPEASEETQAVEPFRNRREESEKTTQAPAVQARAAQSAAAQPQTASAVPQPKGPQVGNASAQTGAAAAQRTKPARQPSGAERTHAGAGANESGSEEETRNAASSNSDMLIALVAALVAVGGFAIYQHFTKPNSAHLPDKKQEQKIEAPQKASDPQRGPDPSKGSDPNKGSELQKGQDPQELGKNSSSGRSFFEPPEPEAAQKTEKSSEVNSKKKVEAKKIEARNPENKTTAEHKVRKVSRSIQKKKTAQDDDLLLEKWTLRKHKTDSTQQWMNLQQKERE